jgi:hypothetical protein
VSEKLDKTLRIVITPVFAADPVIFEEKSIVIQYQAGQMQTVKSSDGSGRPCRSGWGALRNWSRKLGGARAHNFRDVGVEHSNPVTPTIDCRSNNKIEADQATCEHQAEGCITSTHWFLRERKHICGAQGGKIVVLN